VLYYAVYKALLSEPVNKSKQFPTVQNGLKYVEAKMTGKHILVTANLCHLCQSNLTKRNFITNRQMDPG
jgi:hypothetical protein